MENRPHDSSLSPSDNDGITSEQTLDTPHFDEISIQNAQPAVPLGRIKGRRLWPLALILMLASSLVGAVLGLALSRYANSSQVSKPAANVAPEGSHVSTGPMVKPTQKESEAPPRPGAAEERRNDVEPKAAEATRATRPRADEAATSEPMTDTQGGEERAKLQGALDDWIAATNARDIQRQMNFYNQTVNAFYLTRNVPREAVRAEKSRVFARAEVVDIKAAAPGIRVSRDGRTATMRFRKKYAIEGGGEDRRGEVVQELRWQRTDDGWKIVSERDLRVIN
ncbi:MAG TPA: nuclear transport factor 2 family protein [Pyrinomonadaceae bacterium]|nr:nuclear transport factor 2 family protein [Pyrinomonadaceae bacterium]